MKSIRRQFAMYLIFMSGLIAGILLSKAEPGWLLVIGIPWLLVVFMNWEEARYKKSSVGSNSNKYL